MCLCLQGVLDEFTIKYLLQEGLWPEAPPETWLEPPLLISSMDALVELRRGSDEYGQYHLVRESIQSLAKPDEYGDDVDAVSDNTDRYELSRR